MLRGMWPTNLIPFPYPPTWILEHTLILSLFFIFIIIFQMPFQNLPPSSLSLFLSLSYIPFENFPSVHYIIFHCKCVQNIIYQNK